jgi:hypothetical protein
MPNYVGNSVRLHGPATVLLEIKEHTFDFCWIHPIPEDAPNNWTNQYWGTDRNRDPATFQVEEESEDGTHMKVWFRTAWSTPFQLFAYMTLRWPDLVLHVTYSGGYLLDFVGHTKYEMGTLSDTRIYPNQESLSALHAFSKEHTWFDVETWRTIQYSFEFESQSNSEKMEAVQERTVTYEFLISQKLY